MHSAMGLVFFSLGCLLIFTNLYSEKVPSPDRRYIGGVLVLWGVFRIVSSYRRYKRDMEEEESGEN